MSALTRLVPNLLSVCGISPAQGVQGAFTQIRTVIRVHFPRPSERKRVLRHGWKKRMSTPEGRRILMNRILKGRHVYSH